MKSTQIIPRIIPLLVAAFGGLCLTGCAGSGWSPAEAFAAHQASEVNVPGIGPVRMAGLGNTQVTVTGIDGSNTTTVPSVQSMTFTRSTSEPINALAAGQTAIEAQRQQTFIAALVELRGAANDIKSAVLELRASRPAPPAGPSHAQKARAIIDLFGLTPTPSQEAALTELLGGG